MTRQGWVSRGRGYLSDTRRYPAGLILVYSPDQDDILGVKVPILDHYLPASPVLLCLISFDIIYS